MAIKTAALEHALDQLIRARTAHTKTTIDASFVAAVIKELITRRREDEITFAEVEEIYAGRDEIVLDERPRIIVDELHSLSELGSSWSSSMEEIEDIDEADLEDEMEVDLGVPPVRKRRSPDYRTGVLHVRSRWHEESTVRGAIILSLLTVIVSTSVILFFMLI